MKKLSKRTLARASANSTRHTLLAENLVLDEESKNVFALLHQEFIDRLNPTDGIEVCLVEDLASTVWRQRRLVAIETHLFKEAAAKRPEQTYLGRIGGAFSDLCRTPDMHLLDRYESRLHRMFQRTLKNLELLRQIEHTDPSTGELTQFPHHQAVATDAVVTPGESLPANTELPNEPKPEQLPSKPEPHPTTLGEANLGSTAEIQELPNEPKPPQPTEKAGPYPITSNREPEPIDPYAGYPRFEIDSMGRPRRIA
jgi:hypothetical protein